MGTHSASDDNRLTRKWSRVLRDKREVGERELVKGSNDEATYGLWRPSGMEDRVLLAEELLDVSKGVKIAPENVTDWEHLAERNRCWVKRYTDTNDAQRLNRMVKRNMLHLLLTWVEGKEPKAV